MVYVYVAKDVNALTLMVRTESSKIVEDLFGVNDKDYRCFSFTDADIEVLQANRFAVVSTTG